MSNTMIRPAQEKDLDKILFLVYQLSPPKRDEKNSDKKELRRKLDQIIQDPNHYLCVYESDGKILGTAVLLIQVNLSHGGRPLRFIITIIVFSGLRIGREGYDNHASN